MILMHNQIDDFDDVDDGDFAVHVHIGLFVNEWRWLSLQQMFNYTDDIGYGDRTIAIGITHQPSNKERGRN